MEQVVENHNKFNIVSKYLWKFRNISKCFEELQSQKIKRKKIVSKTVPANW